MMAEKADDRGSGFSRRELLKRVRFVGAAASVPVKMLAPVAAAPAAGALEALAPQAAVLTPTPEALETLTAAESSTLEAIVARLIPTDDNGPGASEARAGHYIDRALGGALTSSGEVYRAGLAAVDRYARTSKGAPFQQLSSQDQDAVLADMEADVATGFTPDSSTFFSLIRAHTLQGTFCDPYYGGNANFVGWDLIGYPGVRLAVTADQQRLDARVAPTHRSAYDHSMFSKKKPARASVDGGGERHGD
jgi:gluconate 2-dehydrogenase gamma chain